MTAHTDIASQSRAGIGASPDTAALEVLRLLKAQGYAFIMPTPATHRRVLDAREAPAANLRDILGWSLPFTRDAPPEAVLKALTDADFLEPRGGRLHSKVRVSSLGDHLFLHSAFPPDAKDTVFFGPDTYRFADLVRETLEGSRVDCLVEIGTGSGAGAVVAAEACKARRVIATDLNASALRLARINFAAAGLDVDLKLGCGLEPVTETPDVIIANPPYIADESGRTYRDGGDMHGARLSLDWALAGAEKLAAGGRFVLYTGAAIVDGRDALKAALQTRLDPARFTLAYRELDPDVFGEEVGTGAYEGVERIAAVGAVITRCA